MWKREAGWGLALAAALSGCIQQQMADQPRYGPDAASAFFDDGAATRPPVAGTLAQHERLGRAPKPAISRALLTRGQERFNIHCAPCHGLAGNGNGIIPAHGFPHPPSYHQPRLRNAPDTHFYDVITRGYGVMYPYASRVSPEDRWAIAAYIRALQLSQNAPQPSSGSGGGRP